MRLDDIERRYGHCLPHWTATDATYFVTFRLADSLPREALRQWRWDIDRSVRAHEARLGRTARADEVARIRKSAAKKIEELLDSGAGSCILRQPECANQIKDSLLHFHEERYMLGAWCVMPNHVHVIVKPLGEHSLEQIVGAWKGYTAKSLNKLVGLTGQRWQAEYFDHLIRNGADYDKFTHYVLTNPEKANLIDWPWKGLGGNANEFREATS